MQQQSDSAGGCEHTLKPSAQYVSCSTVVIDDAYRCFSGARAFLLGASQRSVLLLADGCEAVDNSLIELVVAELANAELSFALFKLVLDLDLALDARIWLIRTHYAGAGG